jgi:hypothetical protein
MRRQLINASINGDLKTVKEIVSSVKNTCLLNIAFKEAAKKGHLPILEFISGLPEMSHVNQSACGIRIMSNEEELYNKVAALGHLPVLKFLTESKSNRDEYISLGIASGFGYLPMVKYLSEKLSPGNRANAIGLALDVAIQMGQLPTVMYLSSLLDSEEFSADENLITTAITNNQSDILAFLLGIGAEISKDSVNYYLTFTTADNIGLLLAANYIDPHTLPANIKAKVTPKNIQDGKKLIMEMQAKYLAPRILDICISLRDQPLPQLIEILDHSLNHADNIPYHLKSNMMEDCKHFGEGKKQKRKTYKL